MEFMKQVGASIYDRSFYRTLKTGKVSDALKYLTKLVAFVAIIISAIPVYHGAGLYLWNKDQVDVVREQVSALFPAELELRIKNSQVSTNVAEPYAIPLPEAWQETGRGKRGAAPKNLIVIDTSAPISSSDFQTHDTLMIISRDEVGYSDYRENKVQIQKLSGWDINSTMTRDTFAALVDYGFSILYKVGIVLLVLLPFIIFSGLFVWYVVYLIFGALLIYLAAKLRHYPLTYGESYRYGLYLITLPLLLSYLLSPIFHIPFVFSVVLFATAYWLLKGDTPASLPVNPLPEPEVAPETPKVTESEQPTPHA